MMWDEIIIEMPKFIPAYSESELNQRIEETVRWCAGLDCSHCRANSERIIQYTSAGLRFLHRWIDRAGNRYWVPCAASHIWQAWDEKKK